jgi:peptidoglycan hydrolase-like protein with peptidoglycan-binding domain
MSRVSGVQWRAGCSALVRMTAVTACSVLLLVACASDNEDPVQAAQERVSAAKEAVTEAQTAFDKASAAFCNESKDYILAVDRYGKAFDTAAATVGDVKTVGADLMEPREAVQSSAENVVAAADELTKAKQELTETEAALAAAESGKTVTTPSKTTTTTAEPLVTPATVDRVKQAESDLAAASEGIIDQTPLTEATAQFNAAAFALEVAWLRLFTDAGCLTEEQQKQAVATVTDYTTALQKDMRTAGYYEGDIDGVYGPMTVDAVEQLQIDNNLTVTGFVDRATAAALDAAVQKVGGETASQETADTAAVQSTLKLAGYWTGPVDGRWTPELTDALIAFQKDLGVKPTGAVDAATLSALEQKIAEAQSSPTATAEPTTSTSP